MKTEVKIEVKSEGGGSVIEKIMVQKVILICGTLWKWKHILKMKAHSKNKNWKHISKMKANFENESIAACPDNQLSDVNSWSQ